MNVQQFGLLAFALCVGVNATGLGVDAALYSQGVPTVTDFVRRNPWGAAIILILNIIGVIGLALHFSAFNGRPD